MGDPVIYHGASCGNGSWPAAGGVPSPSELSRFLWLPAGQFQPCLTDGQDNPPWLANHNGAVPGSPGAWFDRSLVFPRAATGGAWAQASFYLPYNLDISSGVLDMRVIWWGGSGNLNNVNWHLHLTVENPGVVIQGGGPGTQVNQIPIALECMYTPVVSVPPTRGGIAFSLVADRMYHLNLYRGDFVSLLYAEVFGVAVVYSIVP